MALKTGLVSWWTLDESGTGDTRVDSHGANDLTPTNVNVGVGTGKRGNGADFELDSSQGLARTATVLDDQAAFTIAGWLKPETVVTGTFYAQGDGVSNTPFFQAITLDSGALYFGMRNDAGTGETAAQTATGLLSAGTWYFIVWTGDTTNINIWLDNVKKVDGGSGYPTGVITTTRSGIGVFPRTTNTQFIDGIMDEVGVWSREITDAEISQLYNGGNGLAYVQLDKTGGTQINWFFSRMRDFTRDLKAGLIPPQELRRRYRDLVTI